MSTRLDPFALSLNQATIKYANLDQVIAACHGSGIRGVGVWRDQFAAMTPAQVRSRLDDEGLVATSLCRGGFMTTADPAEKRAALEDNRRAIEEAAAIGTDVLVLVVGGLPGAGAADAGGSGSGTIDRDLVGARKRVAEAISALVPDAEAAGVTLAIEPLHPMYVADRAVVSTLGQALDIAEEIGSPRVGAVVDTFHIWWDPDLPRQIARAGQTGRLTCYQVCDFQIPLAADPLLSRGHMGDGVIDFASITRMVVAAGYRGPIEVEIFRQSVWDTDPTEVARTVAERFGDLVAPYTRS